MFGIQNAKNSSHISPYFSTTMLTIVIFRLQSPYQPTSHLQNTENNPSPTRSSHRMMTHRSKNVVVLLFYCFIKKKNVWIRVLLFYFLIDSITYRMCNPFIVLLFYCSRSHVLSCAAICHLSASTKFFADYKFLSTLLRIIQDLPFRLFAFYRHEGEMFRKIQNKNSSQITVSL